MTHADRDHAKPLPGQTGLLLDLYELTMAATYFETGMTESASFEFTVRKLPPCRNYLLAAGLEPLLDFLESFRLSPEEIAWLRATGRFTGGFVDRLAGLRFTGEVHAMPEGTVVFPQEPIVRVTAPLPEAQLVETRLINLVHFQTLVASKASRMVTAAAGRPVIDFGLRRAHGAEAGLLAARAAYLAGFAGTSNVLAGARFGLPIFGTMAHAFIQAHDDEQVAFERFALSHRDNVVLLIDTYDTEQGARKVVELAPRLAAQGVTVKAVRIDSGDLAEHARRVRGILDGAGLAGVQILASSGLDETKIAGLLDAGAPVDGFAPGTTLVTSADAPYLDCAYKLVEYAGRPRWKLSEGKRLWPGAKQVYRRFGAGGTLASDHLTLAREPGGGDPLLLPVMRGGRRLDPSPDLESVRRRAAAQVKTLGPAARGLVPTPPPPLEVSTGLRALIEAGR